MLNSKIVVVYCKIHTGHIHTVRMQKVEFLELKFALRTITPKL